MELETLDRANELRRAVRETEAELEAWEKTTRPTDLGMVQHWNNRHLVPLPCKHSPIAAFEAYRDACINAIKVRRAEYLAQIAAL
jgi:hypothetical protein